MRKYRLWNRNAAFVLTMILTLSLTALPRADQITDRLQDIADRCDSLGSREITFWMAKGPDSKNGGFYGVIRDDGSPDAAAEKGLIQQSRFLWSFSTYYEMKEKTAAIKKICDDLFTFISSHYCNSQTGDFYYRAAPNGDVTNKSRMCYAEAFAILALSKYATVFNNQSGKTLAMNCFKAMDKRCHDKENGGFDQTKDDINFSSPAPKETNTVLHCIEALAALYEASGDDTVCKRLDELVSAMVTKIIRPQNYCAEICNLAWAPFSTSPTINYGHDLQTAWLLLAVAPILGKSKDSTLVKKAVAIAKNSINTGYDSQHGGFFNTGIQGSGVKDFDKIWWVQCEALSGLWWTYKCTLDTLYVKHLEETLSWIEKKQLSPVNKSTLYYSVDAAGKLLAKGSNASQEWKSGYHTMRAYLYVEKWIRDFCATTRMRAAPSVSGHVRNSLRKISPNVIEIKTAAGNNTITITDFSGKTIASFNGAGAKTYRWQNRAGGVYFIRTSLNDGTAVLIDRIALWQ